ncbi:MAG: hypothetical protein AAGL96_07835 [Pseudomonadota bacterium]
MKPGRLADTWLALLFLTFALVLILIWVPLDTGTGLVEKVRRNLVVGDALGPTVAGAVIAVGAAMLLLKPGHGAALNRQNAVWLMRLLGLFAASLLVMRYAGPIALAWTDSGYRPLRATPPWNYIGFLLGGTLLVGGLTGITLGRWSARDFAIGFAAALVIALIYDLPFDDLILPPNGDM